MLSKNELKYYSSLLKKKFRQEERKFLAEGKKIVQEGLRSNYECELIIITNEFIDNEKTFVDSIEDEVRVEIVSNLEFHKLKDTVNPQGIAAVFREKKTAGNMVNELREDIICCLDNISDPGNLGTIIRNCDWFGVNNILLSENCAEIYNPKVVRSSMGSLFHLNLWNNTGTDTLTKLKLKGYKILCSDLDGKNIYDYIRNDKVVVVFSNEANGPSGDILEISDFKLTIPRLGNAESLNVASASAVILSHLAR